MYSIATPKRCLPVVLNTDEIQDIIDYAERAGNAGELLGRMRHCLNLLNQEPDERRVVSIERRRYDRTPSRYLLFSDAWTLDTCDALIEAFHNRRVDFNEARTESKNPTDRHTRLLPIIRSFGTSVELSDWSDMLPMELINGAR